MMSNDRCPECSTKVSFWEKFNTSRFKNMICKSCGAELTTMHHLPALAAGCMLPVFARYLGEGYGLVIPFWVQLVLPIPLLFVIFKYILPIILVKKGGEAKDSPDD